MNNNIDSTKVPSNKVTIFLLLLFNKLTLYVFIIVKNIQQPSCVLPNLILLFYVLIALDFTIIYISINGLCLLIFLDIIRNIQNFFHDFQILFFLSYKVYDQQH
jgi:hypothetical protein